MSKTKQNGGSSTSATSFGDLVHGTGPEQFQRNFSLASPYSNSLTSYVGAQGQNYVSPNNSTDLSVIQSAGRRRKRTGRKGKGKRGGFNPIITQGIVPAVILGMQQSYNAKGAINPYGKKSAKRSRSRKFKKSRKNYSRRRF